jgi:enoyl-CoA hydratase/carnithine racemase
MIKLTRDGDIASIRLDRARSRNALDAEGWRALAGAIAEVARSSARVLVLGAADEPAFCAGSDLADLGSLAGEAAARPAFRAMMREAIDALPALPIPTIAAIDGDCFGAGVALALGCDIRIAGGGARFAVTPAKLGISYPREDVARLVAAVGTGQAARLLFTAEPIDAAEAARIGLVEEACALAGTRALEIAHAIAANSDISLALLKAMLQDRAGKAESDRGFDACFGGAEFADRLAAFGRRRAAPSGPAMPAADGHSPD